MKQFLVTFFLLLILVDVSWLPRRVGPGKSVLELTWNDGTTDELVIDNKDIDTPKMWERVNKLIKEREAQ